MRYGLAGRQHTGCLGRWQRQRHARGRPDSRLGGHRARAERTRNMEPMFVTLDVSKLLSGWLNFPAHCRVEGEGNENAMRSEVRTGRREGLGHSVGASGAQGGAV